MSEQIFTAVVIYDIGYGKTYEHLYGDSEKILEDEIGNMLALDPNAVVLKSNVDYDAFIHKFNNAFGDVRTFEKPKEALEWAVEEMGVREVIRELDDNEDECKEFLTGRGYVVYADTETAVEELEDEFLKSMGCPNTLHGQYNGDALEKANEYAAKHGWLKLLDLINAAL